ncbi:multicopper oxidase mco [Sinorhizobium sp. KGO-5]|uniref:multicopper oxidase family protein n=1 Tax=Sinorhizobium sp. KGO-5 TaxID=1470810 RepID=UPI00294A9837|nr:multicopper oxidase mco [Sinorhizobium sp. KGO-5]
MRRRELLKTALAGAAAFTLPSSLLTAAAAGQPDRHTRLGIVRRTIEVNGKAASVFGLQQEDGTPGLRLRAGDAFNVLLHNETAESTIVHWHGLTPPWPNDGVQDAPLPLIAAGANRSYDFPVGKPGTHWMHAHTLQEQALLAAPLIVADPKDDAADEQEIVVLLHDFSFSSPEELLAGLQGKNVGAAMPMDHNAMDMAGARTDAMAGMAHGGGAMAMDLNDIEYDAYLANDRTLDDPEVVPMEAGGRARVRIINGATATAFTIDFGELDGELIAVDGQPVEPVKGRRFPMTMGQRIDVRVQLPREARSFPILALREGRKERTGFILRPSGAAVAKVATAGADDAPVLDLALEAQLRATRPLALRPADKMFDMALTGNMSAYRWGLQTNVPIVVDPGDRVEVTLRNTSMMAHPMHLHGHHFQVVAIDEQRVAGAVRDTVLLPPNRSVTIAVDADNSGQWAFHCHHLYHMATGMMSTFAYRA